MNTSLLIHNSSWLGNRPLSMLLLIPMLVQKIGGCNNTNYIALWFSMVFIFRFQISITQIR
ncbi:hypothetical protein AHAS_Ahas07G0059900 [Arachis hypogaea]